MRCNFTITGKALVMLVVVPLAFQLAFFAAVIGLIEQAEMARMRQAHARDVAAHANALLRNLLAIGVSSGLSHLSISADFRTKYAGFAGEVAKESLAIKELTRDYPQEQKYYESMSLLIGECMDKFKQAYVQLDQGNRSGTVSAFSHTQAKLTALLEATDQLIREQSTREKLGHEDEQLYGEQIRVLLIAGSAFNVAAVCLLATIFSRSTVNRVKGLMDNTIRLALRKPLNPQVGGTDEIARLDQNFHRMALSLAQATQKERAAVANASDVICSIDADSKIQDINPAALKVWGYHPEELIGTRFSQIVHGEDVDQMLDAIKQTMVQNKVQTFENRIRRRDGRFAQTLWSAFWSEAQRSLFLVANDITERKDLDQRKRQFIAMVSDDLKEPLTTIDHCLVQLETGGQLSETGRASTIVAQDSVRRLIGLVNELLDVERMESGKLELNLTETSVAHLVQRSIQSVAGWAQKRRVQIQSPAFEDTVVHADGDKLVQVLVNLLSNAIKFSPKDSSVAVTVSEERDFVLVSVKDRGRGVPTHLRAAIFERFKQVEAADEKVKGGSGLGLAICKAIVEKHGGSIAVQANVENEQKTGSDFWFRIPRGSAR